MTIRHKITLIITTLTMILVIAGCGKREKTDSIHIAFFPNVTHAQALVMKEQGTLEAKLGSDVNVEWTSFNAGPAEVEALFAEEIDIGYIGPVPAISAYVKSKGDVKVIAGCTNAGAVLIASKDSSIQSVADLEGQNVAIPQLGNTQHLSLLHLLSENNLSAVSSGGTVNVVASSNADVANLMAQGNIDAALVPEPWGTILEQEHEAKLILDYNEIWLEGNYATAVIVVRKDFMEEHPDLVQAFIDTHMETTQYVNENAEQAKEIVNKQIAEITQKKIESSVLDQAFTRMIFDTNIAVDSIHGFAEISKQEGFITELPNSDITDSTYLH